MNKNFNPRIVFVTSSMPASIQDWNSVFIGDMYEAMSKQLENICYWGPESDRISKQQAITTAKDRLWLQQLVAQGGIANILRNRGNLGKALIAFQLLYRIRRAIRIQSKAIEIYYVNWLQNCLSLPNDNKPLFLTALGTDVGLLESKWVCKALTRVFSHHPTTILYNAEWMGAVLEERLGNAAKLTYRPLGIRAAWFELEERKPTHWISVSRITQAKVHTLFDWADELFTHDVPLTLIGPNQEQVAIPEWVKSVGSCSLDELRTCWYPNAKGLIFLSEHNEGRPQTIIEAMAAGVPVICLDKALYREFINSGVNGYLVNNREQLVAAVNALEDPEKNKTISDNARQTIKQKVGTWSDFTTDVVTRMQSE